MKFKKVIASKKVILWIVIIAVLIGIRYSLPVIIRNYTNRVLSEMEGYRGHIDGFDFNFMNLGLTVTGFKIERVSNHTIPLPFIYAHQVNTFIDWKSLRHGRIVGRLIVLHPEFNFVNGPTKETTQTGTEGNWTTALKKLKTYTINIVDLREGKITYHDFHSKPNVELFISNVFASVTNLEAVIDKDKKLPSHVELKGNSIGGGKLTVVANINALQKTHDFDTNIKLTGIKLRDLKAFTQAYAGFDFERGELSVYSEAAMNNLHLKGYAKPILEHVKVFDFKTDKDAGFFHVIREAFIGFVFQITKNLPKDRLATEIPFEGDLKEMNVNVLKSIINVYKNEFIKAYPKAIDNSIDINSARAKKPKK